MKNEEIIEFQKSENTTHAEDAKTRTGTVKAKLPEDDRYVEMNQYATNLTISDTDRQNELEKYNERGETPPDTLKLNLIKDKIKTVNINGTEYEVKEIINEPNGFQAIIFENTITHECTLAIAGSYGFNKIFKNSSEWTKDWIINNLAIFLKHLPPQLDTAMEKMDKYKEKYNITEVTGYSLGSILAGIIAKMERNKDVKAYLYNGGLPEKLIDKLYERYGNEVNNDSANIVTMLSKGENLTDLGSIVEGSGIYEAKKGEKGHSLNPLVGLTKDDYQRLKIQRGLTEVDTLKSGIKQAPNNAGVMSDVTFNVPTGGAKKIPDDKNTSNEEKNVPVNNTENDLNSGQKINKTELEPVPYPEPIPERGVPTGEAAPLKPEDEDMSYEASRILDNFKRQWAEAQSNKSVYSQYPDIFGEENERGWVRKHPRPPLHANFEFREAVEFIIEDILRDFALIKGIELKDPYENWR